MTDFCLHKCFARAVLTCACVGKAASYTKENVLKANLLEGYKMVSPHVIPSLI